MKRGTLIAVLFFAALLVGAYLLTSRKPERNVTRLSFPGFDAAAVTTISIEGAPPLRVVAEKKGERWMLDNGRPADPATVKKALDAIATLDNSEVETLKPDRFAELEVDAAKGTKVSFRAGSTESAALTIGSATKGATYVRRGDAVFRLPFFWGKTFTATEKWQLLRPFPESPKDVTRIEVQLRDAPKYAFVKKESGLELEDPSVSPKGFTPDKIAAINVINGAAQVLLAGYVEPDPGDARTGLDKPDRITFVTTGGKTHEIRLGTTDPSGATYARVDGIEQLVTIKPDWVQKFRKKLTDLVPAPPPEPPTAPPAPAPAPPAPKK